MFPETRWTLLADATLNGGRREELALGEFYRLYLPPVKQFLRTRGGVNENGVEDLAQDFFLYLMRESVPRRAERTRGRFRAFLRTVLAHWLANVRDRERAEKRGGGAEHLPLKEELLPADEAEGMESLDRAWALHLMDRALRAVEEKWRENGRGEALLLLRPSLPGSVTPPDEEAVSRALGCSREYCRQLVCRLRQDLRTWLRREVAATVSTDEELEEEMRYLGRLLRAVPPGDGPGKHL